MLKRVISWNIFQENFLNFDPTMYINSCLTIINSQMTRMVTKDHRKINQQVTNTFSILRTAFKPLKLNLAYFSTLLFNILNSKVEKGNEENSWSEQPLKLSRKMLVETSETIYPPKNSKKKHIEEIKDCQWLAGIIDADGSLLVSQKGYTSLEITTNISDIAVLEKIQLKYGGFIQPRSGVNAMRYRLHNKTGMIKIVQDINGYIRNPARFIQ
jgi:hypothetical protein